VLAGRGQTRRALELATEAVDIVMATDHLNEQADAMSDLALVYEAAERPADAAAALATAVETYEAKGNVIRARETRRRLARPVRV
jgi:hypothetical protein